MIVMRSAVASMAVLLLLIPVPTGAWGMEVHRFLMKRAIDGLPQEVKPFYTTQREFIAEHVVDPDLWRVVDLMGQRGVEEPNHFLDIDGLDEPRPFTNVPRDWDAYVARYGAERANRMGRLPWRIEEIYGKLVKAFQEIATRPYAADNARYLSAVLAHYLQDAHQPFHAVMNYDGQLTNQRGIHSRFETELVLRNLTNLKQGPVEIRPIGNIRDFAFQTIITSESLVHGVLDADLKARTGRELYDDGYFAALLAGARPTLERRLNESVSATASVIVAAWTAAGKPALPVDRTSTPARIPR
jgi:alkylated DNA nucleotide flippase Atl1